MNINKHNLLNIVIVATPLTVFMTTFFLSGHPIERSSPLAGTFLLGSILSIGAAVFTYLERGWR